MKKNTFILLVVVLFAALCGAMMLSTEAHAQTGATPTVTPTAVPAQVDPLVMPTAQVSEDNIAVAIGDPRVVVGHLEIDSIEAAEPVTLTAVFNGSQLVATQNMLAGQKIGPYKGLDFDPMTGEARTAIQQFSIGMTEKGGMFKVQVNGESYAWMENLSGWAYWYVTPLGVDVTFVPDVQSLIDRGVDINSQDAIDYACLAMPDWQCSGLRQALSSGYTAAPNGAPMSVDPLVDPTAQWQWQAPNTIGLGVSEDRFTASAVSWTTSDKCEWLRENFPQTTSGVQALGAKLAKVETQRVRTHLYRCSETETVFDGFIILGPNEGYSGNVTLSVPAHGAVDSYVGATFSGNHVQIGANTVRGLGGTVTGVTMTYWPWLDEDPPLGTTSQPPTPPAPAAPKAEPTAAPAPVATTNCVGPKKLAFDRGWKDGGWADEKYGGLRVELVREDQLPPMWEAICEGGVHVYESDTNRAIGPAVCTIYPPYSCRETLGFSK